MTKTTSNKFSERLSQYSLLSLALATIAEASGQETIVYTNVGNSVQPFDTEFLINFDNDDPPGPAQGVHEFGLKAWAINSDSVQIGSQLMLYAPPTNSAIGLLATSFYSYKYPFQLSSGAPISSGDANWQTGGSWQFLLWDNGNGPCNYGSAWCPNPGEDRFLGLKFLLNNTGSDYYYGWVRINVPDPDTPGNFIIKDYAYNSVPGESILAGQTSSLSIDDSFANKVKVVALNKSIGLYNLPDATNYRLYSLNGQEILKGEIRNNSHVIEANSISNGVYIIEIQDKSTKAILKKKIVL